MTKATKGLLEDRGLIGVISEKGKPAPLRAGIQWLVELDQLLAQRSQEAGAVHREARAGHDFWIAFFNAIIVVRQLIREAWSATAGEPDLPADHEQLLLAQPLNQA